MSFGASSHGTSDCKLTTDDSNIGHDVNALWKHYDDSVDEAFLIQRQQMHVSILSVGSFLGRLLSGKPASFTLTQPVDS